MMNERQPPNLAQRVLEVGQRLGDGTVAISFSPDLVLPGRIFGGWSDFDHQDDVVQSVNREDLHGLHGYNDWRRITDDEGAIIARIWNGSLLEIWRKKGRKHAPQQFEKEGWQNKDKPWFWLASIGYYFYGRVRCGGYLASSIQERYYSFPVPVVRSGPARDLDI